MSDIQKILVPDVGGEEVEIIEICFAAGDTLEADEGIVTVETDKASMDIPAPFAGKLISLSVSVGDKIKEGDVIGEIQAEGASAPAAVEAPVAAPAPAIAPAPAPVAAPATSASAVIDVPVPDIGEDGEVEVIEILVAVGDVIEAEDGLITLETDKATMDVPSSHAGTVKEIYVSNGDKVKQGSLVIKLETAGGDVVVDAPAPAVEAPVAAPAAVAAPVATSSAVIDVAVPDIGEDGEVDVIEVLVAVGDVIEEEDGLITLETDKATMDVPSTHAGTVKEVYVSNGDKVKQGSLVIKLETKGGEVVAPVAAPAVAAPAVSAPVKMAAPDQAAPVPASDFKASGPIYTSPSIRRIAREFGVDLTVVKGTARKGRISKEDVQNFVKAALAAPKAAAGGSAIVGDNVLQIVPVKPVDFSKFGETEEKALGRITKISGPFLHRNWVTIPHVTQFDEADITECEAFRKDQNAFHAKKKTGLKITPLVFVMKAVARALEIYPNMNSSLSTDGGSLILKKFINIGIAVATPGGLVVPVIKDVNKKGIEELSRELIVISGKARDGKLKAADMQGGTFTISSLGGIGGTAFTPIVNAPEVGILGVSKSEMKPKWNGKEFVPRLMVPLSLSYDHRVIDGAEGASFSTEVANNLTDLRRLVL